MTETPNSSSQFDERWMQEALVEAERAAEAGEVPVGAVIVHDGRIVGRGRNQMEGLSDPTAHAEILAVTAAANALKSWRLDGTTVYVTLEPCVMCIGAIFNARVSRLVFAAHDPKRGAVGSVIDLSEEERLNHHLEVSSGPLREESTGLLKTFFEELRKRARATDKTS
ncbi:MAG: tRNA adenosine(34) deaminase TadA [Candidatus Eisenbacteria bacterium]|nr:tRNA adenosine(34) deaminase TadA [Candidatus Eisenbacteria bacterium]